MIAERVAVPEQVGLSAERLERISDVIQSAIDRGVISGAVTLVGRNGQVAHLRAYGQMNKEQQRPMRPNTLFRLASMTKPVIAVAIMTLLEEGKLLLTDPVHEYVPAFKDLLVQVPNPTQAAFIRTSLASGDFHLVPAHRDITVRDLLTHTSGVGSATVGPAAQQMIEIMQGRVTGGTLAEVVPQMARVPLSFQPGTVWEYSGGFGFDILAHITEVISGQTIDVFLRERLFEPLGMRDTMFHVPAERLDEVAVPYERGPNGLQPGTPVGGLALSTMPTSRYNSGGGGLAGTAEDYARFAFMLAAGGTLDGQKILGRKTVELMASNHIGQLPWDRPITDLRGYRFGLGVRVLDDPAEASTLASRGTFGWAGAFGTNSWIDPVENMVGVYLIQRMQDPNDVELRKVFPRFQTAAYQALE